MAGTLKWLLFGTQYTEAGSNENDGEKVDQKAANYQ